MKTWFKIFLVFLCFLSLGAIVLEFVRMNGSPAVIVVLGNIALITGCVLLLIGQKTGEYVVYAAEAVLLLYHGFLMVMILLLIVTGVFFEGFFSMFIGRFEFLILRATSLPHALLMAALPVFGYLITLILLFYGLRSTRVSSENTSSSTYPARRFLQQSTDRISIQTGISGNRYKSRTS